MPEGHDLRALPRRQARGPAGGRGLHHGEHHPGPGRDPARVPGGRRPRALQARPGAARPGTPTPPGPGPTTRRAPSPTTSGTTAAQHHRKGWCILREHEVKPAGLTFYHATLRKYGGLIKSLRRTFEVLRGEDRILKRQPYGEDVDIDALVEAYADARVGLEMGERLFTRRQQDDRNIAVMLMVDMSGSTKGWINQAEREALILLSEALETLGDRFAIYGFSGWTRKRCEVFPIKRFGEPYDDLAKGRICGIEPRDYTRMGAPIRHLTGLLRGRGRPHQAPDHPLRRQAGRLRPRLPRRLWHRGHPPGPVRGPPGRRPPLLHHHRRAGARVPPAHVRRGQLYPGGRRGPAAGQGLGDLPPADQLSRAAPSPAGPARPVGPGGR